MQSLTMTEKILTAKVGGIVAPSEVVEVEPDLIGIHDILGHIVVDILEDLGVEKPGFKGRLAVFLDHAAPPPSKRYAEVHMQLRRFARRLGAILADVGYGIMHQVIVEEGLARPGDLVVASDSHTTTIGAVGAFATGMGSSDIAYAIATGRIWLRIPEAVKVVLEGELKPYVTAKDLALAILGEQGSSWANYKSIEFTGPLVSRLSVSSRMTLTNMATEMGAKAALFPVDSMTIEYYESLGVSVKPLEPDPGASYYDEYTLEASLVEPMLALPDRVDYVEPVSSHEGKEVDVVFLGSCTNGREEDFRLAARILRGRRVREGTRCIAIPASRRVYQRLLAEGVISVLASAGCVVAYGTCGPCWGGHFGVLGPGEVAVSTSNRNFKGRMGDPASRVYLASPATAAASAVEGRITDPSRYIRG